MFFLPACMTVMAPLIGNIARLSLAG